MLRSPRRLPLALLLSVGWVLLTSCALLKPPTPTIVTTVKPDCVNWQTLTYSAKADSQETVIAIIANNERRKVVCGS